MAAFLSSPSPSLARTCTACTAILYVVRDGLEASIALLSTSAPSDMPVVLNQVEGGA